MSVPSAKPIDYADLNGGQIEFLDAGGVLHIRNYWGARHFLEVFRAACMEKGVPAEQVDELLLQRKVSSLGSLAQETCILKDFVHNHIFAMAMTPLIEALGCDLRQTHIDCGVIRYQFLNDLRDEAEQSGLFEMADFKRLDSRGIPEIFGYSRLPPHRDVRWPHIRIIGFWMALTDLAEGETVTIFPEAFDRDVATGDPSVEPFPLQADPNDFGMGRAFSPAMKAGDLLVFHAATVHSSPARQVSEFRGSIDFRVAYPCIDDFRHYKSTFEQGRELIHNRAGGQKVSVAQQKDVISSMIRTVFASSAVGMVQGGVKAGEGASLFEYRFSIDRRAKSSIDFGEACNVIWRFQFSASALLWAVGKCSSTAGRYFLLLALFLRSDSYFWLYKGYKVAGEHGFGFLRLLFRIRCVSACRRTTLPMKNFPIRWNTEVRETQPQQVLAELMGGR